MTDNFLDHKALARAHHELDVSGHAIWRSVTEKTPQGVHSYLYLP